MKKPLFKIFLSLLIGGALCMNTSAKEVQIQGQGYAALSGYDINYTRAQEDEYMRNKSHNAKTEFMHTQQIKEATRQAEKRLKEDKKLASRVNVAVVNKARERAEKNALEQLITNTLGPNALKNKKVNEKFDTLYAQFNTYTLDKNFTGHTENGNYVANVDLIFDTTKFQELVKNTGIALNSSQVRSHSIMVIMDEYFGPASDFYTNSLTEEVTSYNYNYDEKDKQTTKASYKDSSSMNNRSASGYGGRYGSSYGSSSGNAKSTTSANYGEYKDYSKKENESFLNIKKYAPKVPMVSTSKDAQTGIEESFRHSDIDTKNGDVFKSKYFKGKPIPYDKLVNTEELHNFIKAAKNDVTAGHPDYIAIGISQITDDGTDANGRRKCSGKVSIQIYSTVDSSILTSRTSNGTAYGEDADQARSELSTKLGREVGEILAETIQTYWKDRNFYGQEYELIIKGSFLPAERIKINKALKTAEGIESFTPKTTDTTGMRYTIQYQGDDQVADVIFEKLLECNERFNKYTNRMDRNQIILEPLK